MMAKLRKRSKKVEASLETKKTNAVSTQVLEDWGPAPISSQDIAIPMVWVTQYMSDKVKDQEAKAGEYRDNVANDMLGGNGKTFDVVPFHFEKKWVEYTVVGNDQKFLQIIPVTIENENLPYEEPGLKRDMVYYIYALNSKDVQAGLPCVIPLRRTSASTAKNIVTQMYVKNRQAGLSPAAYVISLDTKEENGAKGDYFVATMKVGRETTPEEQSTCLKWLKTIRAGKATVKEDHEEDVDKSGDTVDIPGTPRDF